MKKFIRSVRKWSLIGLVLLGAGAFIGASVQGSTVSAQVPEVKTIDLTPQKLAALQDEIVTQLASCESAGHTEDYGLVTFDQNKENSLSARNIPSFGVLQFKVTTVQTYYKQQTGNDLTGTQAIMLALDADGAPETSKALAKWVIFNVDGGIYNWQNCATKLGLVDQVTVIKKLMK